MLVQRPLKDGRRTQTYPTERARPRRHSRDAQPCSTRPAACTRHFPAPHTGHIFCSKHSHTGVCSHSAHSPETRNESYALGAYCQGILHMTFFSNCFSNFTSRLLTPLSFLLYGSQRRFRILSNRLKVNSGLSPPGCVPRCVRPMSSAVCCAIIWPTDCLRLVFCCFLGSC